MERKFLRRPVCSVLGRGHGAETLTDLGVSVHIPGNCGERYEALPVTESVRTYMHNVWPYDIRTEFKKRLNEFVRKEVDAYTKDPRVVIELMGLNGFGAVLGMEDEKRRKRLMKSVREEQFVVLDGLDQRKVAAISIESLSHGRSVLMEYRNAGGKKRMRKN